MCQSPTPNINYYYKTNMDSTCTKSLLTGWFVFNAMFDRCRNKVTGCDISVAVCVCVFGWLFSSKPCICMWLWWQSPGVMRSLTQTHQPETGWKWVGTNLCRGDRGGSAAVMWAEFEWGRGNLCHMAGWHQLSLPFPHHHPSYKELE